MRKNVTSVDSFRSEVSTRLSAIINLYDTRKRASQVAGVTAEQLGNYLSVSQKPPFEVVARLALDRGGSLDWLATGEGEMMAGKRSKGLDQETMREVVIQTENFLNQERLSVPPEKKWELFTLLYELVLREDNPPLSAHAFNNVIRLATR